MKSRVICVSRAMVAGGEEVARAVSQRMNFRYVDEEIVAMAAERDGVDVRLVQDAERRQSFVARLLESFTVAPAADMMVMSPGFLPSAASATSSAASALRGTEHFRQLIRDVVRDTASQGDVVIVAHAAAMALAGEPGVLRVFVTASPNVRAARLATARGIAADEAAKTIKDSDKSRRDYLMTFYGISEELPVHYDLVANTDVLPLEQVVEAVVAVARG